MNNTFINTIHKLRYVAGVFLVILCHHSYGQITNDTKATAEVLTNLNHWCSVAEAYTNEDASGSESTNCDGSVYNTAWFKFTATTDYLNFKLIPVGLNDNNVVVSLRDENDNRIICSEDGVYNSSTGIDEYVLETENLTIGSDYYIIVANGSSSSSYEGTFGICISNKPSFDFKEGAHEISNLTNWCSTPGYYSNVDATGNFNPSCGSTVYNDVWFTFIAQHDEANIVMTTGTLDDNNGSLILLDENESSIYCDQNNNYLGGGISEYSIDAVNLTVGDRYYILVGNQSQSDSREGTFGLCVNNAPNFDFKENAIELTGLNNWCSEAGAYNNIEATGNESTSCDGSVYNTVWFKVTATTNYLKFILTPETYNDNYGIISLMDVNENTVVCTENVISKPGTGIDEFVIESENLTVGDTYYILVGTQSSSDSYEGTFGICISDKPSFDFKEGAVELTDLDNWCSGAGAYTNAEAIGSTNRDCTGTVYSDVWFKFLAQHDETQIRLTPEAMEYSLGSLALLDEDENVLYCDESFAYNNGAYEYVIDAENLNTGSLYYIVVGIQNSASYYNGSFGLCVNNTPNYDFKEDAIELTDRNNWCSGSGAYTNEGATGSESTSCDGSVYNTVWYKFTAATSYLYFKLIPETLNNDVVVLSLEDETGTSIECVNNGVYNSTTGVEEYTLETESLTTGTTYYILLGSDYSSDGYEGTFGICVNDQPSFDKKIGAVELTDLNSWCSAADAYTNEGATGNEGASCYGSTYNTVWLKFTAATSFIDFKLIPQTLNDNYVVVSLEDEAGSSVACVNNGVYNSSTGVEEYTLESESLTIGTIYYIKIANSISSDSYEGTFGICVNDHATFDRKVGALALTNLNNYCSEQGAFTNLGATGSESTSCDGSVYNSVWFKFTAATEFLNFRLKAEGINDSYVVVALQDENANPVACTDEGINSGPGGDEYVLESENLSIGTDYYIMVANTSSSSSYEGSFSICATDQLTNDFIAGAIELTNLNDYCSDAQAFSNVGAGGFEDGGCGDAYNTVWFKFTATTDYFNVKLTPATIDNGSIVMSLSETPQNENILMCIENPIYNPASGLNEYRIEANYLQIGNDYYIMVANTSSSNSYEGTFGICISNVPSFDYKEGALVLDDLINWCSDTNEFSNVNATGSNSSNCDPSIYNDVWFTFTAQGPRIELELIPGTLDNPKLILQDDLENELGCGQVNDLVIVQETLITGSDYFIIVGSNNSSGSDEGSFSICINNPREVLDELEIQALRDLYEQTDGLNWFNNTGWPSTELEWESITSIDQVSEWYGITVQSGDIIELNLDNNGLNGILNQSLIDLSALLRISLSNNLISFIPSFQDHLNKESLFLDVRMNFLTFDLIENNFFEIGTFLYQNQKSPDVVIELPTSDNIVLVNDRFEGINNVFQWEKYDGVNWVIADWDFNNVNYSVINGQLGEKYRCRITNTLVTGEEIFSSEYLLTDFISYTYYAISSGDWNDPNIWSLEESGISATSVPTKYDFVQVVDFHVIISSEVECKQLTIESANGSLITIDGRNSVLNVFGDIIINNLENKQGKYLEVLNGGEVSCQ